MILSYFNDILDFKVLYRTLPLVFIVPIGVSLGTKLFKDSSKEKL